MAPTADKMPPSLDKIVSGITGCLEDCSLSYLFGASPAVLGKMRHLTGVLRKNPGIPDGYKKRLLNQLSVFTREVTRVTQ